MKSAGYCNSTTLGPVITVHLQLSAVVEHVIGNPNKVVYNNFLTKKGQENALKESVDDKSLVKCHLSNQSILQIQHQF